MFFFIFDLNVLMLRKMKTKKYVFNFFKKINKSRVDLSFSFILNVGSDESDFLIICSLLLLFYIVK